MKAVLVTGAAGFIGSHVAEGLLRRAIPVVGLDDLNDYYPVAFKERNLAALKRHKGFTFERADIVNFDACSEIFSCHPISHVAHLAARAGVRPSIVDPFIYESVNVRGTLNLLELARKKEIENFVLTSSSSVYGNSTKIPFREDDSITDLPISPYAATKKAAEVLGHTFHHLYGLNVNVVRPFTVYGPRGRPDMAPWIFLESALSGRPIRKFGDGTSRRDYTFIDDFVAGFIAAIERPLGYEIFNLGNSATVSLNDALDTIERVSGRKLTILNEGMQPGDVDVTYADISKARSKLDYHPATSFEAGMTVFHRWLTEIQRY